MILNISLWAKAGVPKTLVKRKFRLHSMYFPQNSLTLTESSREFSDLHSTLCVSVLAFYSRFNLIGVKYIHLSLTHSLTHPLTHSSIDPSITNPTCQLRGVFLQKKISQQLSHLFYTSSGITQE